MIESGGVIAVDTGRNYSSSYLKSDGTLWAMGNNAHGKLGVGSTGDIINPAKVDDNVRVMSLGWEHYLSLIHI